MRYGSDAIVEWLVELGIHHVALNPGATIRGLQESLVRDDRITTVLALHEETAVGIAHGFWKATGRPMAVFLHDLVGIQHASMALFNATVDRAAMVVLGGSGPADERQRRPWLDWIHYSTRHDSAVHDVVKATAEPSSLLGVRDDLVRGLRTALSSPTGPVFIGIDTDIQEGIADDLPGPSGDSITGFLALASADQVDKVAALLAGADRPVIVVDRPVRGGSESLCRVVEATEAAVIDLGGGFCFPTGHWAYQTEARRELLQQADLVVLIEARDPAWALTDVDTGTRRRSWLTDGDPTVVSIGCAGLLNIPGVVVQELLPTAVQVTGEAAPFLDALADRLVTAGTRHQSPRRAGFTTAHDRARAAAREEAAATGADNPIHPAHLVASVRRAIGDRQWLLSNGIVKGWPDRLWDFGPGNLFLGRSAGEGLGYGMPASLGAALAHRDDDRLVVNLQSDGDLMYTASALWTAAHHRLPLLTVMYGTYGKDELHQRELATLRARTLDTTHIGIRLDAPRIDFAALATAQGVEGIGPVTDPGQLESALEQAVRVVCESGRPALVHAVCR